MPASKKSLLIALGFGGKVHFFILQTYFRTPERAKLDEMFVQDIFLSRKVSFKKWLIMISGWRPIKKPVISSDFVARIPCSALKIGKNGCRSSHMDTPFTTNIFIAFTNVKLHLLLNEICPPTEVSIATFGEESWWPKTRYIVFLSLDACTVGWNLPSTTKLQKHSSFKAYVQPRDKKVVVWCWCCPSGKHRKGCFFSTRKWMHLKVWKKWGIWLWVRLAKGVLHGKPLSLSPRMATHSHLSSLSCSNHTLSWRYQNRNSFGSMLCGCPTSFLLKLKGNGLETKKTGSCNILRQASFSVSSWLTSQKKHRQIFPSWFSDAMAAKRTRKM